MQDVIKLGSVEALFPAEKPHLDRFRRYIADVTIEDFHCVIKIM